MRYFIQDPASPTGWRGPFEENLVRRAVEAGQLTPTCLVCAEQAGAQPIIASAIPKPEGLGPLGQFLLLTGGALLSGMALGALVDALSTPSDPEPKAIRRSARRHEKKGAVVLADVDGYARPPKINGHIPDVYAVYEDRVVVEEFENERSVFRSHARQQDAAFSTWARRSRKREYQQVVVPGGRGGRG